MIGIVAKWALGIRVMFLGKNTLFRFPFGAAMRALAWTFGDDRRYRRAQKLGRLAGRPFAHDGLIARLPGLGAWTGTRDLRAVPRQTFREWWERR